MSLKFREWLPHRFSWGPLPAARHSAISWTEGPFFYVYGGVVEYPSDGELQAIYKLDTRSMTWEVLKTVGKAPPLDQRTPNLAAFESGTLYNISATFNMNANPPNNPYTFFPNRPLQSLSLFKLNLATLTWSEHPTPLSGVPYGLAQNSLLLDIQNNRLGAAWGIYAAGNQINHSVANLDLNTYKWNAIYCNSGRSGMIGGTWEKIGNYFYYFGGQTYQITNNIPVKVQIPLIDGWQIVRYEHKGVSLAGLNISSNPPTSSLVRGGITTCQLEGEKVLIVGSQETFVFDVNQVKNNNVNLEPQTALTPGRSNCTAKRIGDRIYVFGGVSGKIVFNDIRVLQLIPGDFSETWTNVCQKAKGPALVDTKTTDAPLIEKPPVDPFIPAVLTPVADEKPVKASSRGGLPRKIQKYDSSSSGSGSGSSSGSDDSSTEETDSSDDVAQKKVPVRFVKSMNTANTANVGASAPLKKAAVGPDNTPAAAPISLGDLNPQLPSYARKFALAANNKDLYPDVEFKLGKKSFWAHKVVLCTVSHEFQKLFDPKAAAARFNKKKAEESESLSQWTDEETTSVIKLPEFFDSNSFLQILNYFYSGYLEVKSSSNASELSEIAFEYLLDDVMQFCDSATTFPCKIQEPEDELLKRYRGLVGHAVGSDVSFVFNRKQRLFSHKVFLCLFSDFFRAELATNTKRKYIEIQNQNINAKAFTSFLKMLYTGFNANSLKPSLNASDLLMCAIQYREKSLLEALSTSTSFDTKNFCVFWKLATEMKLTPLVDACDRYLETHLSRIVRDSFVFENWDKELLNKISERLTKPYEQWCFYASWLDILWFAHHAKVPTMKGDAVKNLQLLINVENVVSVLVASHATGEKGLRSVCVDFVVKNGVNVSAYQSMKNNEEHGINRIADLSQSLRTEVEDKVKTTVGALSKTPTQDKIKTGFLTKHKNKCALCKRLMKREDLSKQLLPPVLAGGKKFKIVCSSCGQLAELVGTAGTPKPGGGATGSSGISSDSSKSDLKHSVG